MRVAIIPARGGSVRIPRKNIRDFRGRPIIWYAIQAAKESRLFDDIIVSTDDAEIADVSKDFGVTVFGRRQDDGTRGTQAVAQEVLREASSVNEACVIYPCSPLLASFDLARGMALLARAMTLYTMSVQQEPLADAGCFYFGKATAFRDGVPLIAPHTVMVPLHPNRVCDINTPEDWARAESMYDALRRAS